jgi:hypothetical protein
MVFVIDRLVKLLGVTGDIVIEPVEEEGARATVDSHMGGVTLTPSAHRNPVPKHLIFAH